MSTTDTAVASNSSMEVETSDISIDSVKDTSDHNISEQEIEPVIQEDVDEELIREPLIQEDVDEELVREPLMQEDVDEELGDDCAEGVDTNRDTPTPDLILPNNTALDATVENQNVSKSPEHEQIMPELEPVESKLDVPEMIPAEHEVNISESDDKPMDVETKDSQNCTKQESQKKRKAEEDIDNEEEMVKLKKSRQSCVIVYEGKSTALVPAPVLDLTVEATPPSLPPQEITLDESQEFSLRYEKDISPIPQGDRRRLPEEIETQLLPAHDSDRNRLLLAEITTLKAKLDYYKTENTELHSQIEKLKEKSECSETELEATFPSCKEGVHTYTEKCPLYGTVLFTVDDRTNQVVRAQVKQLSLLDECLPVSDDKYRSSLSSGVLADKSFQSNGSSVSVPGPFPLPVISRKSVMSTISSTTSSTTSLSGHSSVSTAYKKQGLRSWGGPFAVPHPPPTRLVNVHCRSEILSCGLGCSKTFPCVELPSHSPDVLTPSSENPSPSQDMNMLSPTFGKETAGEQSNVETILKNGTQQSNGEAEEVIKNGESAEDEQQKLHSGTPQRQSAVKAKRKRQATTSTPVSVKRSLASKTASQQKQATQVQKSTTKETTTVSISPGGKPVFARWTDGIYYPGWVYSEAGSMLKVYFCDGNVKEVTSFKIIPAHWVVRGTTALAANAEETYDPYLIVDIEEGDEKGPKYILEGAKSCIAQFPRLALTEAHVQDIKQPPTYPSGASIPTQKLHMVSLDNVLDCPRTRTSTSSAPATPKRKKKNSSSVEASTSHTSNTTHEPQLVTTTDSEYSTEPSSNDDIRGFEMHPLDRESSPPTVPAHLKGKLSVGRSAKSRKGSQEDASVIEELGPIPKSGSTIFSGNSFLITYAENKKNRKLLSEHTMIKKAQRSESDTDYTSDTTDLENSSPAFNKERLRTQIRRGGGKLYSSLDQVPADELDKTFLITDSPSCTPLYIQCLVKGIPAYSHYIIIKCCSENTNFSKVRQNEVMLPAGWSLERQMWVERSKSITVFKDQLVLLAINQNEVNIKFWKKILTDAGAKVQLHNESISVQSLEIVNFIVSDNECSPDLLEKVAKQGKLSVPVVSLTWVQQCIIDNDRRPHIKHPAYLYSYVSEPESPEY